MLHRFIILKGISAQALTLTFKEIVNLSNREKWEKFFCRKVGGSTYLHHLSGISKNFALVRELFNKTVFVLGII